MRLVARGLTLLETVIATALLGLIASTLFAVVGYPKSVTVDHAQGDDVKLEQAIDEILAAPEEFGLPSFAAVTAWEELVGRQIVAGDPSSGIKLSVEHSAIQSTRPLENGISSFWLIFTRDDLHVWRWIRLERTEEMR